MTTKTKFDAAKTLLEEGWTLAEVKAILGDVSILLGPAKPNSSSPWWSCMDDDQFSDGTALVEEWHTWLEEGKP